MPRNQPDPRHGLPSRSLVVALVLACATLMLVDRTGGDASPVDTARRAVGEVLGPTQAGVSTLLSPVTGIPGAFRSQSELRDRVAELEEENAELASELRTQGYDEQRIEQLEELRAVAGDLGYALVPARVIGIGPAQSFTSTVTIDAGSDAGLRPDLTVVNGDGLVGRVTDVTSHTATVLLIVDATSRVGARIGDNQEMGLAQGDGELGDKGRLELSLVDRTVTPQPGQAVLTWGSDGGAPYVSGVPIGEVTKVYESLRDGTYRADLAPYADFSALDMVGVVVPPGTESSRPVIEYDESVRLP